MTKHPTAQPCPICGERNLQHAHCGHPTCPYFVTTCVRCDREQVVRAFIEDHEEDCAHRQAVVAVPQRQRAA